MKNLKNNLPEKSSSSIKDRYYKSNADALSTYDNYIFTDTEKKQIDKICNNSICDFYKNHEIDDDYIEQAISSVDIIKTLEENNIDFEDYKYNIYQKIYDKIADTLREGKICARYDERKKRSIRLSRIGY